MTSTSDAKDFIQRAIAFREEGRLDEALLASRRAADIDPEDANAWWQMALSTWQRDGAASALPHLRKTVALADGYAYGWHRLGIACNATSSPDEAINAWETALELDGDRTDTLQELADAYGKRDEGDDDEKRFEVLKTLEALGSVSEHDWNILGINYYNRNQHQRAIQCYRKYAAETGSHIAYYNLGLALMSKEVQQRTDAIDAWRRAQCVSPDYEPASLRLKTHLPVATQLREKVAAGRKVFLAQDEWYANYVNPYELMWLMGDEDLSAIEIKAIQKAKKKLLQEIELEDGVVEWMPGLKIDKSRAIKVCDELSDDAVAEFHQIVATNRELCSFLTRGDVSFFLVKDDASPVDLLNRFDHSDDQFPTWISSLFAPQLDLVLGKAFEARDVNAIEALLGGRRLVIPAHEDRCFEGSQRQIARMLDPLRAYAERAPMAKPTASAVQALLNKDSLGQIVSALPQYFQDVQAELTVLIRQLCLSANNDHGDPESAKEILAIGKTLAARSPSMQHRLEEDSSVLDELIKEQNKNSASVQLGDVTYSINNKGAEFGQKRFAAADVTTLRWGLVYNRDSRGMSAVFNVDIGKAGDSGRLTWTARENVETQIELFQSMTSAALNYLMPAVVERMQATIDAGRSLNVGAAVCSKHGVHFTIQGWFSSTELICPWSRLNADISNGDLILHDPTQRKARIQLPLAATDNALALFLLITAFKSK